MTILTEELRSAASALADDLAEKKIEEAKLLKALASDARLASDTAVKNKALKFAGMAERNFLEGKRLSSITAISKAPSAYDYEAMGTTEDFPCTLSFEDGIWEFFLPPTPSVKNGKRGNESGRYIGYLVKNLIAGYRDVYGDISLLKEPVVAFEFGFRKDDPFSQIYDADNRDNKRILDALTGIFYPDDNVLSIRTVHYGTVSESEYTRVFVMEKAEMERFFRENSQW